MIVVSDMLSHSFTNDIWFEWYLLETEWVTIGCRSSVTLISISEMGKSNESRQRYVLVPGALRDVNDSHTLATRLFTT